MVSSQLFEQASLFRRLAAMFYDLFILVALLMLGTWILIPLTHGEAISPGDIAYQLYLLLICGGYYTGSWFYGGQTVGMRAWRIKVQTEAGTPLSWRLTVKRLLWALLTLAPCGLGLWTALFHPQKKALYDVLSKTRVVYVAPK